MQANADSRPTENNELLLRRLLPPGDPLRAAEAVDCLRVGESRSPAGRRPFVMLNMVSSADGRASIAGRTAALGNRGDRELFHALRSSVDAVMAGAGTVRSERYGPIIREEHYRQLRRRQGLSEEPLACIVSASLALAPDIPLLAAEAARVVIVTASTATLPDVRAQVDYVRAGADGRLDLSAALAELHDRLAVRTLLCEGGPHLNGHLLHAGLVDELFLSLSPRLAGGDPARGQALRIVAGAELEPPIELELLGALESGSQLFLRYGVRVSAAERVSRETMLKSSLAS